MSEKSEIAPNWHPGNTAGPAHTGPKAPRPGDLIAGKYRVLRSLGQGGMGTVLVAQHELLDVPVAVKVLSADLTNHPQAVGRFLREAQATARLKSEHVVRVMDVGTTDAGQPFIVMELLEGQDLEKQLLKGPVPSTAAVDFVLQAIEAVAQAHAIGIVHRDLKPANLFVATLPAGRQVVKVLDFGVAKLVDGTRQPRSAVDVGVLTGKRTAIGSPGYMAPEQVRGELVDGRTDIWAFGTILYELLTGQLAFPGGSVGEIFGAILHTKPPPLRQLCSHAPVDLEGVVQRCMQPTANERYRDLADLARAIAPFGSGAFEDYASRVEQILRTAAALFDPDTTTMTRLRKLEASGVAAAVALRTGQAPLARTPALAQLPPPPEGEARHAPTVPAPRTRRSRAHLAALAILGISVGAAAVVHAVRGDESPTHPITETPTTRSGHEFAAASQAHADPPAATVAQTPARPVASPTDSSVGPTSPPSTSPAPSIRQARKEARSNLPSVLRSAD